MTEMFCTTCHTVGKQKRETRGSFVIELALWLMLIVPGLIYSLWRLTTRRNVCRACGSPNIVPTTSPVARQALGRSPT